MPAQEHKLRVAYLDEMFIGSDAARPLRILAEYLEPLDAFRREQIKDTIVFFGSARLRENGPLGRYYQEARSLARLITEWSMSLSPGRSCRVGRLCRSCRSSRESVVERMVDRVGLLRRGGSLSRGPIDPFNLDQFNPVPLNAGFGPPVAQSRSSMVCTTGTDVPPAI